MTCPCGVIWVRCAEKGAVYADLHPLPEEALRIPRGGDEHHKFSGQQEREYQFKLPRKFLLKCSASKPRRIITSQMGSLAIVPVNLDVWYVCGKLRCTYGQGDNHELAVFSVKLTMISVRMWMHSDRLNSVQYFCVIRWSPDLSNSKPNVLRCNMHSGKFAICYQFSQCEIYEQMFSLGYKYASDNMNKNVNILERNKVNYYLSMTQIVWFHSGSSPRFDAQKRKSS